MHLVNLISKDLNNIVLIFLMMKNEDFLLKI